MKKTGGEIIVDYLIQKGIEYIAGIPGHGCLAFFDALRKRVAEGKIKYIQVKQEMSAVHIADGYYRSAGKPMAVFTSIGPGSLNTSVGIGTAFVDSTPILVIIGDAHVHMRGMGILQEIERKRDSDILSCFEPITKRCWRVENIIQLPKIIKRAYSTMMSNRRGPVVISVPMDVQADSLEYEEQDVENEGVCFPAAASEEDINRAYELMRRAKRPVIITGGGLLYSGAYDALRELAEKWGAAVVTTMAGKSSFPENHPLYGWHGGSKGTDAGNYLCRTSDVILSLGCRFADETTSSYRKGVTFNFPETKLIQVDIDPAEIGKNYPCSVGIVGDVSIVLKQLIDKLEKESFISDYENTEYYRDIQNAKAAWFARLESIRNSAPPGLTISRLLFELNAVLPEDCLIVTSSGNSQAQVLQEYCFKKPGTHITTGGFSTMGFSLPAAIGAKLSGYDAPVVALMGDGDFYMSMQELSTAVQYNANIVVIVLNNYGWMAIRDLQLDMYGKGYDFGNDFVKNDGSLYTPCLSAIAESFGLFSQKVTRETETAAAVKRALDSGRPSFIEVIVEREYPASGGIATGWWDVPVPHYISAKESEYRANLKDEYLR